MLAANQEFRDTYATAKQEIISKLGPVLICSGNDIYLVRGASIEKRNTITPEYTVLKIVDHIPLGLFVLLDKRTDTPLPDHALRALQAMKDRTVAAIPTLIDLNVSETTRARLAGMLRASEAFETEVLKNQRVTRAQLNGFVQLIQTSTMANVDEAVNLEMTALDQAVKEFRKKISAEDWARLHVVITSGHMPRDHERRMQYFAALLNQEQEGDRLIYQEGSDDIQKAIDLLATHILDETIAREYFAGDRWRMHRDLLSDSATKWLKEHPPEK